MKVLGVIDEDFSNYKKPSLLIMMPYCDWKCGKELCQNSPLAATRPIDVPVERLAERYVKNDITKAIVFGGLEPFFQFEELRLAVKAFRDQTPHDIVIYTGYNKDEIEAEVKALQEFDNIIIKFGRYIPNTKEKYDKVLGVKLASENQYAEKTS